MNDSSDEPPLPDRIRSWARTKAHASHFNPFGGAGDHQPASTLNDASRNSDHTPVDSTNTPSFTAQDGKSNHVHNHSEKDVANKASPTSSAAAPPPVAKEGGGEESPAIDGTPKMSVVRRFLNDANRIIRSSWINWLLIFVPVGMAIGILNKIKGDASPISPTVVFSINAIAIIPLASLLAFATESVAAKLGDTVGALMNVTFGNAVELIIFIIALVAKEIRIVQASLLGSILANLLLILGMCFLFGGLRFREQV